MPLFGLTNWSAETFPYAWERYPVLQRFREVIVSGRVGVVKPDPAIFALMRAEIERHLPGIAAARTRLHRRQRCSNAEAATALGWHGVHHTDAAHTEAQLRALGVPV